MIPMFLSKLNFQYFHKLSIYFQEPIALSQKVTNPPDSIYGMLQDGVYYMTGINFRFPNFFWFVTYGSWM